MARGRLTAAIALSLASASCLPFSGPDCIDETRFVAVGGPLTWSGSGTAPQSPTAQVDLSEARNHRSKSTSYQDVLWGIRAVNFRRADVTGVHIHRRTNDQLLVTIPIDTLGGDGSWITLTNTRRPYPGGALGWSDLYELVGSGGTYLDIHTSAQTAPVLRGDLNRTSTQDNWREFFHAYCS